MSKPRKQRTSVSGQYVSPLLNELEWLEDEAEEPAKANDRPKARPRKPANKPQMPTKPGKRKTGPIAKINWNDGMAAVASKQGRRPAPSAPLLLIDKPKPRYRRTSWFRELLGIDPWTEQRAGEFADALQSFQLGLDGIMKGGEELRIIPPRRRAVVIDVDPQDDTEVEIMIGSEPPYAEATAASSAELRQERADADVPEAVPESSPDIASASAVHRLQQFGLFPFRFSPFDQWIDIGVTFERPFADDGYALVATTNEPGCRTVIINKKTDGAVVRLLRDSMTPQLGGELNWIALGDQ